MDKKDGVHPTAIPPRIASDLSYCAFVAKTSAWNLTNDIVFTSCINWNIFPLTSSGSFDNYFRYSCISLINAGVCSKASSPNVPTLGDKYSHELVCGFVLRASERFAFRLMMSDSF